MLANVTKSWKTKVFVQGVPQKNTETSILYILGVWGWGPNLTVIVNNLFLQTWGFFKKGHSGPLSLGAEGKLKGISCQKIKEVPSI